MGDFGGWGKRMCGLGREQVNWENEGRGLRRWEMGDDGWKKGRCG